MDKPACFDIVLPCLCKACQLHDVREMVRAESSKLHCDPRFPVATSCTAKKFAACSATVALPTADVAVCGCDGDRCDYAYVIAHPDLDCDSEWFLSRPCIDFADSSPPCFLPSPGFVHGSSQSCPVKVASPVLSPRPVRPASVSPPVSPSSPVRRVATPPVALVLPPHLVRPPLWLRPVFVPVVRFVWLVPVLVSTPFGLVLSFVPFLR